MAWTWGLIVFFSCGGLIPSLLLGGRHQHSGDVNAELVQWVLLGYSALRLSMIVGRGLPDWMGLCLYGYSYTWLGLAPLVQVAFDANPLDSPQDVVTQSLQAAVVLAGLLSYDVVRQISRGITIVPSKSSIIRAVDDYGTPGVFACILFCLALTPILVSAMGGVSTLFSSRFARLDVLETAGLYSDTSKANGALLAAAASVIPFAAIYALQFLRQNGRAMTPPFVFLIICALSANVLLNNPISTSRFWFLVVVLSLVFTTSWAQKRGGFRAISLGFIFGSTVLFPYLDLFRTGSGVLVQQSVSSFFTDKTDYDSLIQIGNAISYVRDFGFQFGHQFLGAAFFWVPRSVWETKAIDTGSLLANFVGYPNANLSSPLWGELFIDFGWAGVIGGFSLLGLFSEYASQKYLLSLQPNVSRVWSFMYPPLAVYQVLILRGSLLQAMGRLFFLIIVLVVFARLFRKREKSAVMEGVQ